MTSNCMTRGTEVLRNRLWRAVLAAVTLPLAATFLTAPPASAEPMSTASSLLPMTASDLWPRAGHDADVALLQAQTRLDEALQRQSSAGQAAYRKAIRTWRATHGGKVNAAGRKAAAKARQSARRTHAPAVAEARAAVDHANLCVAALQTERPWDYPGVNGSCAWSSYLTEEAVATPEDPPADPEEPPGDPVLPPDEPAAIPPDGVAWREALLDRVNALRQEHGRGRLTLCATLSSAATKYAKYSGQLDWLGHTGPDGSEPWTRAVEAGYRSRYVGENLAWGYLSVDAVFTGWRNSRGHFENMLGSNYTHIGLGYYKQPGTRYVHNWGMKLGTGGSCALPPPTDPPAPGNPAWAVINLGFVSTPPDAEYPGVVLTGTAPPGVPAGTRYVQVWAGYDEPELATDFVWWQWSLCSDFESTRVPLPGAPPGCTVQTHATATDRDYVFQADYDWSVMVGTIVPGHEIVWSQRVTHRGRLGTGEALQSDRAQSGSTGNPRGRVGESETVVDAGRHRRHAHEVHPGCRSHERRHALATSSRASDSLATSCPQHGQCY